MVNPFPSVLDASQEDIALASTFAKPAREGSRKGKSRKDTTLLQNARFASMSSKIPAVTEKL
jgi:hypothetical protein